MFSLERSLTEIRKLISLHRYDEALTLLSNSIQSFPRETDFLKMRANILLKRGSHKLAIDDLKKSLIIEQTSNGHFLLASSLWHAGHLDEALKNYKLALALEPDWPEGWEIYSWALFCANYAALARKAFNFSLRSRRKQRAQGKRDTKFIGPEWYGWLGNLAHLDTAIKAINTGLSEEKKIVAILRQTSQLSNKTYFSTFQKYIDVIQDNSILENLKFNPDSEKFPLHIFSVQGKVMPIYSAAAIVQRKWENREKPPLLSLTDTEKVQGWNFLSQHFRVPADAKVVCLHVRGNGFWDKDGDKTNFSRSADIDTYHRAIRILLSRGYYVFRMGDSSMDPLKIMDPHLIDYAISPHKSDFLDIFLISICDFLACTNSSLYWVAASFGRPALMTNWIPMGVVPLQRKDLILYKQIYSERNKQFLSAKQISCSPLKYIWSTNYLSHTNLTALDNTPEQLESAFMEMIENINHTLRPETGHQKKFRQILKRNDLPFNGYLSQQNLTVNIKFLE